MTRQRVPRGCGCVGSSDTRWNAGRVFACGASRVFRSLDRVLRACLAILSCDLVLRSRLAISSRDRALSCVPGSAALNSFVLCCGSLQSRRARVYVTHWAKEATNSGIAFFALLGFGQVIGGLARGKSNLRDRRELTGIWRLPKSLGLLDFGSRARFAT